MGAPKQKWTAEVAALKAGVLSMGLVKGVQYSRIQSLVVYYICSQMWISRLGSLAICLFWRFVLLKSLAQRSSCCLVTTKSWVQILETVSQLMEVRLYTFTLPKIPLSKSLMHSAILFYFVEVVILSSCLNLFL
ncbi:unnamed protein product [Lupinus luteus]|uniref:Uncharacterized protein n=1 Tax=Lupinus luteus TaxID=3873 RepID=A0AAV1VVW3_LUPLU